MVRSLAQDRKEEVERHKQEKGQEDLAAAQRNEEERATRVASKKAWCKAHKDKDEADKEVTRENIRIAKELKDKKEADEAAK